LIFWAERIVGLLAIGAIVFACFWIAAPLVGVLAWGALIAIALAPLHRVLARASGNRPKTVATLMVLVLLGLVIFPLSFLPASFEGAAEGIASVTNNWTELKLPPPPSWVSSFPLFGPMINERWAAAVWIPVALWLFYQGETGWALFTTVLGIVIGVLDNFIKPLLIGRGAGVPLWIIFIGVIGGILKIGFIGIFIGPLVLAAAYSIITNWLAEVQRRSNSEIAN
jgi:predicted PurR-regulated permease PerM